MATAIERENESLSNSLRNLRAQIREKGERAVVLATGLIGAGAYGVMEGKGIIPAEAFGAPTDALVAAGFGALSLGRGKYSEHAFALALAIGGSYTRNTGKALGSGATALPGL